MNARRLVRQNALIHTGNPFPVLFGKRAMSLLTNNPAGEILSSQLSDYDGSVFWIGQVAKRRCNCLENVVVEPNCEISFCSLDQLSPPLEQVASCKYSP